MNNGFYIGLMHTTLLFTWDNSNTHIISIWAFLQASKQMTLMFVSWISNDSFKTGYISHFTNCWILLAYSLLNLPSSAIKSQFLGLKPSMMSFGDRGQAAVK